MDQKKLEKAIKTIRENSQKRKFKQGFDLIINLKELDLKKPENQLDLFVQLHATKGKKAKICALVGGELSDEAKKHCDFVVMQDEFERYAKDKRAAKKLAGNYDFFISQADIMGGVAGAFGRTLGPRGKMPNPKAGAIIPPRGSIASVVEKLQRTVRVMAKTQPIAQVGIGSEDMKDSEVADNINHVFDQVLHHLPGHENNIKSVFIKLTMGKPTQIGLDGDIMSDPVAGQIGTKKEQQPKAIEAQKE